MNISSDFNVPSVPQVPHGGPSISANKGPSGETPATTDAIQKLTENLDPTRDRKSQSQPLDTHSCEVWDPSKKIGKDEVAAAHIQTAVQQARTDAERKALASAKKKLLQGLKVARRIYGIFSEGAMHPFYHPEAIDIKHRYGRYINSYFEVWKNSDSKDSFNDWMKKLEDRGKQARRLFEVWRDSGSKGNFKDWVKKLEGEEAGNVNAQSAEAGEFPGIDRLRKERLVDQYGYPSTEIQLGYREIAKASNVQYLRPSERKRYQMKIQNGVISTEQDGILDSEFTDIHKGKFDQPFAFVVDLKNNVYVGKYVRGKFNHSSLTAGGPVRCAGELILYHGKLVAITDKSGHYQTTKEMLYVGLKVLQKKGVDLTRVILAINSLFEDEREQIDALKFIEEYQKKSST